MNGPMGSRFIFPDIKGTFQGGEAYPDFHGTLKGPCGDWARGHADGSGVSLDVRLILNVDNGAMVYGNAIGRSVRDKTDPTKASLTFAKTFETGDNELRWLNNKVLAGVGRKDGNSITVDYYEMSINTEDTGTPTLLNMDVNGEKESVAKPVLVLGVNNVPYFTSPSYPKHVYSVKFTVGAPIVIMNGPMGSRFIFPDIKGTFQGGEAYPDFHGTLKGPCGDWARGHADGSGVSLDVRLILNVDNGAMVYGNAIGRSVRDKTDPTKASLTFAKTFETGDNELRWLNNKVLAGVGRKDGNSITVDYYEVQLCENIVHNKMIQD